jgi:hypothetical protein
VFTVRYGLIPYMKHITFRLLKVNSPGERCNWFNHGISMALTIEYFCNILLQTYQKRNTQNTEGYKPHKCLHLPIENLHLFTKRFFGGHILNLLKVQISPQFSSSLRLISPSYIG